MAVDILQTTRWRKARNTAPTAVESALATTLVGPTAPTQLCFVEGFRGGRIRFYCNGANNETATVTLYDVNQDTDTGWQMEAIGSVALTFGTSVAVAVPNIAADPGMSGTKRWADTAVWSVVTFGTAMLTRVGGNIAAFSPADNSIAELMVSDFGAAQAIALVVTTYGLTAGSALMPIIKLEV